VENCLDRLSFEPLIPVRLKFDSLPIKLFRKTKKIKKQHKTPITYFLLIANAATFAYHFFNYKNRANKETSFQMQTCTSHYKTFEQHCSYICIPYIQDLTIRVWSDVLQISPQKYLGLVSQILNSQL
jgi:hypothetical protein